MQGPWFDASATDSVDAWLLKITCQHSEHKLFLGMVARFCVGDVERDIYVLTLEIGIRKPVVKNCEVSESTL